MSASDAAPLPRLGEVFFDVRGNSRTMRMSWYADTGIAVFSIWQGGMCTGTFRLPIEDLPRMVEILQRGPQGQRRPDGADYGDQWQSAGPDHAEPQDYPTGSSWWSDEGGGTEASGGGGYEQERFVPPYMQPPQESYPYDNPAGDTDRPERFGGPAYPPPRHGDRSRRSQFPDESWTEGGYSDDPHYR